MAVAQIPDKAKLDRYFDALEKNNKFMGSASLIQNGKTVYSRSVGFADIETAKKADENTKYRIGSISKTFTSAMVFKAIDDKKLQLTDKLEKYFPDIANAGKISIGDLLSHRSGIHNFTDDQDYRTWNTTPKSSAEMIEVIKKGGSDFEPGSKAAYSNSNYVLLSFILERIYKKTYAEILSDKIIKPAGLKNTYYGGKIDPAKNEATSYNWNGKWEKWTETDMSVPMGAGAVASTPADLSKFMEALFAGKIISAASLEQMKTIRDNYGMGLFKFPFNNKTSFGHTGGIDGFSSMLGYFPEDGLTMAITSNGSNYEDNNIALAMLSWYYNIAFEVPEFKSYAHTTEELSKFVGNYASAGFPLQVLITLNGSTLMAQATGQSAFPLEGNAKNIFGFVPANLTLEFKPESSQMILKQGGGVYTFDKVK
jgi:CubicO group peptidase (beta-lactamase class C family)